MQLEALLQNLDELIMGDLVLLPEDGVVHGGRALGRFLGDGTTGTLEPKNVLFAVDDHLVGDLDEETGHTLVSVVITRNGVDHLDGVHQDGEGLLDCNWIAVIEGLNEALEGLEVLYVVLGLVEVLSDSQLDGSPVGESEVNAAVSVAVSLVGRSGSEHVTDGLAVLRLQLLGNGGEHAHAEFPVFKLVTGTFVLLVDALVVLLVNGRLDLDRPALENSHELVDHILVNAGRSVDVGDVLVPFFVVLFQFEVAAERTECLLQLFGEFLENDAEVALLLDLADTPVFLGELVNEWLVDVVDEGVQSLHRVIVHFSEKNLSIVLLLVVDGLAGRQASEEIGSLASELEVLSVGHKHLVVVGGVDNLTGVVHALRWLVVNE